MPNIGNFSVNDHQGFYQKIQGKSAEQIRRAAETEDKNTANAMLGIAKHYDRIMNMNSGDGETTITYADYQALYQQVDDNLFNNADLVRRSSRVKLADASMKPDSNYQILKNAIVR